jgi:deoxyribodipyrimidine photo-lyase
VNIVWFQNDLRLNDNPALHYAMEDGVPVIAVYIYDDNIAWGLGDAQKWWLHHSLLKIKESLASMGVQLYFFRGNYVDIFQQLHKMKSIQAIYSNTVFHPNIMKRFSQLEKWGKTENICFHSYIGNHLQHPSTPSNGKGEHYKVFTQYWKKSLSLIVENSKGLKPRAQSEFNIRIQSENIEDWGFLPQKPNWAQGFEAMWAPGEVGAQNRLRQFIDEGLSEYANNRDRPDIKGVSHLSPHIHFGEISPWQVWRAVKHEIVRNPSSRAGAEVFLKQLGWREFSHHLLYYHPDLPIKNFNSKFEAFQWEKNPKALIAWQKGQTGYPIVDAGMRELWHTGTMHNRVRMIVASFLVKDLFIHWREGEKWFWNTLLDADLANNAASWQWVAGSGADAAPYFRIFNPILQGQKFDPEGAYVRKWVPEISHLPNKMIHTPWQAETPPLHYPGPIVAHEVARKKALSLYHLMRA